MKLFQIFNGLCHYYLPHTTLEEIKFLYAADIVFAEAPDYVFEGWGFDETAEGDARFIKPIGPEGFEYDDATGTWYDPKDLPDPNAIDELTQIQLALAELAELITGV